MALYHMGLVWSGSQSSTRNCCTSSITMGTDSYVLIKGVPRVARAAPADPVLMFQAAGNGKAPDFDP